MTKRIIIFWVILAILLVGCRDMSETQIEIYRTQIPFRQLIFPDYTFDRVFWFPDNTLLAEAVVIPKGSGKTYITYAFEGSSELQKLFFKDDPTCPIEARYIPWTLLPNGKLGMRIQCLTGDARRDFDYLVAYD